MDINYGTQKAQGIGMGTLLDSALKEQVAEVRRINDKMMVIKLIVEMSILDIIFAYVLQTDLNKSTRGLFGRILTSR